MCVRVHVRVCLCVCIKVVLTRLEPVAGTTLIDGCACVGAAALSGAPAFDAGFVSRFIVD